MRWRTGETGVVITGIPILRGARTEVKPRTICHYTDHRKINFHSSALLSTEFDTGSKHVGCGSGENTALIGHLERRLKCLFLCTPDFLQEHRIVIVVVVVGGYRIQRQTSPGENNQDLVWRTEKGTRLLTATIVFLLYGVDSTWTTQQ